MILPAFAREAAIHFQQTAAVAPSSRRLTQAMVAPLYRLNARRVVEFGAGTGVITRALLRLLPQDGTLLAFEINPRFVEYLRRSIDDPRLLVFESSAENAGREIERFGAVDAVVSSLAIGFFSDRQRSEVMEGIAPFLQENAVLTQYQYIHGLQFRDGRFSRFSTAVLLNRYFRRIERRVVWWNVPPALVFTCYGRRDSLVPN